MLDNFMMGLITARTIVANQGIEALDAYIKQREADRIETTALRPEAETR